MVTKIYKVYGANGHRQRASFAKSNIYDWSTGEKTRIVSMLNADITGSNKYTILVITCDTSADCDFEFISQLSDGIFENCRIGDIVEVM